MRAKRIDGNQARVVKSLEECGCEVQSLAALGEGVADLLVNYKPRQRLFLMEVKDGSKPPSKRVLTPAQVEWHKRFPVVVVNNTKEAVLALLRP